MEREDPLVVAKLRNAMATAEDLEQQLLPDTLDKCHAPTPDYEDSLTTEEKVLAISRLEAVGKTRASNGERVHVLKKAENGEAILSLRYGWVCQAGFYPEDLNKLNQDNLLVFPEMEDPSMSLFAVCDGHGKAGTECSTFCVEKLGKYLASHKGLKENPETAFEEALGKVNREMHKQKKKKRGGFDDTLAGTTAISVLFHGDEIVCANVGDSRAVLATEIDGRLTQQELSIDHTPYRADERERCRDAGAVIMTMDQLEGYKSYDPNNPDAGWGDESDDGGDPPRLWLPNKGCPGVAFTRSVGDEMAESIGCNAKPEILRRQIIAEDRFIVIASDGIWEFLSSQTVVDMVSKFKCPYEAARAIVGEAYKLWLHYEVRTDDITAIVIFLEGDDRATGKLPRSLKKASFASTSFADMSQVSQISATQSRPVRREMSRKKREMIEASRIYDDDEDDGMEIEEKGADEKVPKSALELAQIKAAISSNFLFSHLQGKQLEEVLSAFKLTSVNAGEKILVQGQQGDKFYVVSSGEYDCFVTQEGQEPKKVMTYSPAKGEVGNPSFGELALLHNKPRAATVVAKTKGKLWSLDRRTFRKALIKQPNKQLIQTFRSVKILDSLGINQLHRLADHVSVAKYQEGDEILKQGDVGDCMFVMKSGSVRCVVDGNEVLSIGQGGYFGERALLHDEPRAASVFASEPTETYQIHRKTFEDILGPLADIISAHTARRELIALGERQMNERQNGYGMVESHKIEDIITKCDIVDGFRLVYARNHNGGDGNNQSRFFTLKSYGIKEVEETKVEPKVIRNKELLLLASARKSDALFVDSVFPIVKTFVGERSLHVALEGSACGALNEFMSEKFTEPVAQYVIANVASMLSFLHARGILCRSINPQSLMLDLNGRIKLAELGNGKLLEDNGVRTFTMCGDAGYIAPEQVLNAGHSFPVDYWALGILLYESLIGSLPFEKTDGTDMFSEISKYDPENVDYSSKGLSDGVIDLIKALTRRNPDQRLTSETTKHPWLKADYEKMLHADSPFKEAAKNALQDLEACPTPRDHKIDVNRQTTAAKSVWYHDF